MSTHHGIPQLTNPFSKIRQSACHLNLWKEWIERVFARKAPRGPNNDEGFMKRVSEEIPHNDVPETWQHGGDRKNPLDV